MFEAGNDSASRSSSGADGPVGGSSSETHEKYRMVSHLKHLLRTPPELPMAAGAPPEPGDEKSRERLHRMREQSKSPHARTPRSPGSALLFRRASKSAENTPREPQVPVTAAVPVEVCEMSPPADSRGTRSPSQSVTIAAFDEQGNPIHTELGRRELALLRFKDRHRGQSNSPRGVRPPQDHSELSSSARTLAPAGQEKEAQRRRLAAARRAKLSASDATAKTKASQSPPPSDPSMDEQRALRRRQAARARPQRIQELAQQPPMVTEASPDLDIEVYPEVDDAADLKPINENTVAIAEEDACASQAADLDTKTSDHEGEQEETQERANIGREEEEEEEEREEDGVQEEVEERAALGGEEEEEEEEQEKEQDEVEHQLLGHDNDSNDLSSCDETTEETQGVGKLVESPTLEAKRSGDDTKASLSHSLPSLSEESADDEEIVLRKDSHQAAAQELSRVESNNVAEETIEIVPVEVAAEVTSTSGKKKRHRSRKVKKANNSLDPEQPRLSDENRKASPSTESGDTRVTEEGDDQHPLSEPAQDTPHRLSATEASSPQKKSSMLAEVPDGNSEQKKKRKRNRKKKGSQERSDVAAAGTDTKLVAASDRSENRSPEPLLDQPTQVSGQDIDGCQDSLKEDSSSGRPRKPSVAPSPPERSDTPTPTELESGAGASDLPAASEVVCDEFADEAMQPEEKSSGTRKTAAPTRGKKRMKSLKKLSSVPSISAFPRDTEKLELDFSDLVDEVAVRQELLAEHYSRLRILAWNQAQEEKEIEVSEIRQDMLLEKAEAEGVADSTLQLAEEFADEKERIKERLRESARHDLERTQENHKQDLSDMEVTHQRMLDFAERQHQSSLAAMNQTHQAEVQRLLSDVDREQRRTLATAEATKRETLVMCEAECFNALLGIALPLSKELATASQQNQELRTELDEVSKKLDARTQSLIAESLAHESTREDLQRAGERHFELETLLNASEDSLKTLKDGVSQRDERINELERDVASNSTDTGVVREQLKEVRAALAESVGSNEALQAQLIEANGVSTALREELEDLERDTNVATHQLKESHKEELKTRDSQLQMVLATVRQEVINVQQLMTQVLGSELMESSDHALPCLKESLEAVGWIPDPQLAEPSSDSLDTDEDDDSVQLDPSPQPGASRDTSKSPDPRAVVTVPIFNNPAEYQRWIATELCDPIGNRHFTTVQKLISIICNNYKIGTADSEMSTERFQTRLQAKEEELEAVRDDLMARHRETLDRQKRSFQETACSTLKCFYDDLTNRTAMFEDEASARIAFNHWLNTITRSKTRREAQFLHNTVSEMGAELKVTVPALEAASKELAVLHDEKANWDSKFARLDDQKRQLQERVTMLTDDRKDHDDEIRRRFHKIHFENEVLAGKNEILQSEKDGYLRKLSRLHRQRNVFFARFYARMPRRRMTFFSPQTSIPGMEDLVRERVFHGWAFLAMKDRIVKFDKLRNTAQELREEIRRRNASTLGAPSTASLGAPVSAEKTEQRGRRRIEFDPSLSAETKDIAQPSQSSTARRMSSTRDRSLSPSAGEASVKRGARNSMGGRSLSPSSPKRQLNKSSSVKVSLKDQDNHLNPQVVSAAVDVLQQQVSHLKMQLGDRDHQLESVKGELSQAKSNYEELLSYSEEWYSELEALKSKTKEPTAEVPAENSSSTSVIKQLSLSDKAKKTLPPTSTSKRSPRGGAIVDETFNSQADPVDPDERTTSPTPRGPLPVSKDVASPNQSASPLRRVSL